MDSNPNKRLHQHHICCPSPSPWPNLPPELLCLIIARLESEEDIRHFRTVCKSWNSSALLTTDISRPLFSSSFSKFVPKLIPSLQFSSESFRLRFSSRQSYPLVINSYHVYMIRRTIDGHRWLVGVEQQKFGKIRLIHPLSKAPMNQFFPIECPGQLRDFYPLRISTGYHLRIFTGKYIREKNGGVTKLIYWKNPKKSSNRVEEGSLLMVLYNDGALRCIGTKKRLNSEEIFYGETRKFHDIIEWNDKIVAVDVCGRLYGIKYNAMSAIVTSTLASSSNILQSSIRRKRLFESNGQLYLVVKRDCCYTRMVELGVYVLNIASSKWEELSSLGDQILFISSDSCFFIKSSDLYPGRCFQDCILFSKGCFDSKIYDPSLQDDDLLFGKDPGYLNRLVGVHYYNKSPNFMLLSSYSTTLSTAFRPPSWFFESLDESDP